MMGVRSASRYRALKIHLYLIYYLVFDNFNFCRLYLWWRAHVNITFLWINKGMMRLYSALLCIAVHPKLFTIMWGGLSSTTTSDKHPLGWCDGCHRTTVPVRSPHTSYRWRGERVIEPIKCIRSPHTNYRWRGERVIEPIKCIRSPHTSYRWRGERDRANQVYTLTTHQLQVERRESHRANQVYTLTTHQLQVERRESHRANQVYTLTTHQLQVERRESHRTNQVDGDY